LVGSQLYVHIGYEFGLGLKQCLQIEEEASESGKAGYVDFKCVVWHEAFYEVLATISELSRTGQHVKCEGGVD